MRSKKRNKSERAFHKGVRAGFKRTSMDSCPYEGLDTRGAWLAGWREGRGHLHSGQAYIA